MSDARPDPEASCGAGTVGTGGEGSSTEAGSAAAAPQTVRVPAAMSRVSGFGTRTLVLAPRRACRSRQLIHAEYRIEIEMRVPRRVSAHEEFQPRGGVRGEGRILLELAREFILQLRVLCEYGARDLFRDVGLQVFLVLEARVEEPPGGERVRRLRFEQLHHQARERLRDRYEQGAGGDVLGLASPGTAQGDAHAALEGCRGESRLSGAEGFDAHGLAVRAHRLAGDAVQRGPRAGILRPR